MKTYVAICSEYDEGKNENGYLIKTNISFAVLGIFSKKEEVENYINEFYRGADPNTLYEHSERKDGEFCKYGIYFSHKLEDKELHDGMKLIDCKRYVEIKVIISEIREKQNITLEDDLFDMYDGNQSTMELL